jgi:acyl carrier protein
MDTEEIKLKLNLVFREVFEDDTIVVSDQMVAADVENWDSLSNVLMIDKVEQTFGIKIKLKEVVNFKNVGDLIKCIQGHIQGQ